MSPTRGRLKKASTRCDGKALCVPSDARPMDSRRLCSGARREARDGGRMCADRKRTAWPDHLRNGGRRVSFVHIQARRLGTSAGTRMRTCEDALHDFHLVRRQLSWHLRGGRAKGWVNEVLAFPRVSWLHTSASLWVHFSGSSVFRHAAASGSGYCQQGGKERRFEEVLLTADQADLDVGKERPTQRVGEVEHLAVVCARTRGVRPWAQSPKIESGAHLWNLGPRTVSAIEQRRDAEEDGLGHTQQGHDD